MVYYVTHPNLEFSAKVDAPSTDKARTTFLDFLERTGRIYRRDRQHWRINMVAERLEFPEEAHSDIELSYGYGEERSPGYRPGLLEDSIPGAKRAGVEQEEFFELPYEEVLGIAREQYQGMEGGEFQPSFEEGLGPVRQDIATVSKETPKQLSPIQRLALKGYVR